MPSYDDRSMVLELTLREPALHKTYRLHRLVTCAPTYRAFDRVAAIFSCLALVLTVPNAVTDLVTQFI
jgi:hypothetical protein